MTVRSTELAATTTALAAAGAVVTETSLRFLDPEGLSSNWDAYEDLGHFLGSLGRAYPWWVGDFLNDGEEIFGEEFAQIEAALPHSPQTLANYKSVAKHVPRSRRRKGLSYSVHAEVAYEEPRQRDQWLETAVENGWKREEMRDARRAARLSPANETGSIAVLPAPPKKTCPACGHILED